MSDPATTKDGSQPSSCTGWLGREVEYHLEWRKNGGQWYFGNCTKTMTGALLAIQAERKRQNKLQLGDKAEWRIIEHITEKRIVVENL